MIAFNAQYDGRVIVPDEAIDLPPNHASIVQARREVWINRQRASLRWRGLLRMPARVRTSPPTCRTSTLISIRSAKEGGLNAPAAYFANTSFWISLSPTSLISTTFGQPPGATTCCGNG